MPARTADGPRSEKRRVAAATIRSRVVGSVAPSGGPDVRAGAAAVRAGMPSSLLERSIKCDLQVSGDAGAAPASA